jgi:aminoglycoside 3-N-acetyltransferase
MTAKNVLIDRLAASWRASGVAGGDVILLHSSLKRIIARLRELCPDAGAATVLQSFVQAVGNDGTLLFPLFNFGFAKGEPFDIRATPSEMGALTEAARVAPGAVRTGHPIYSFAALGKHREKFRHINNVSGYGLDSPFGLLRELNGKIGVLDLPDQNSMTFYHHVEEMLQVPYRFMKNFTGQYTDARGHSRETTCRMFVRDLDRGVTTHVNPAGELMWAAGLYMGDRPGTGTGLRVVSARAMYEFVEAIIKGGHAEGLLYMINKPEVPG